MLRDCQLRWCFVVQVGELEDGLQRQGTIEEVIKHSNTTVVDSGINDAVPHMWCCGRGRERQLSRPQEETAYTRMCVNGGGRVSRASRINS